MVCQLFVGLALLVLAAVVQSQDIDTTFTLTVHANGLPNRPCRSFEIEQIEDHLIDTLNGLTPAELGISDSPYASFQVYSLELEDFMVSQSKDRNRRLQEDAPVEDEVEISDSSFVSDHPNRRRLYGYWYFGGYGRCSCCYCNTSNKDYDHWRRGLFSFGSWFSNVMDTLNNGYGESTVVASTSSSSSSSTPGTSSSSGQTDGYFYTTTTTTGTSGSTATAVAVSATPEVGEDTETVSASAHLADGSGSDTTTSVTVTETSITHTSHTSATNTMLEDGVLRTSVSESTTVAITLAADLENEIGYGHCMRGYTYTISIDYHDL